MPTKNGEAQACPRCGYVSPDHIADASKKVEPAPEWEDEPIADGRYERVETHCHDTFGGGTYDTVTLVAHVLAVSEPGFMGYCYVYPNGETDTLMTPVAFDDETEQIVFPIAWRRSKEGK
jgi:hypothetical protein